MDRGNASNKRTGLILAVVALETASVEDFEQRIDVGARLQFGDSPLGAQQFVVQPVDFRA